MLCRASAAAHGDMCRRLAACVCTVGDILPCPASCSSSSLNSRIRYTIVQQVPAAAAVGFQLSATTSAPNIVVRTRTIAKPSLHVGSLDPLAKPIRPFDIV